MSQNAYNMANRRAGRFKWVCWHKRKRKWFASVQAEGKRFWVGYFDNELTAAKEANAVALRLHGEFASLNEV